MITKIKESCQVGYRILKNRSFTRCERKKFANQIKNGNIRVGGLHERRKINPFTNRKR